MTEFTGRGPFAEHTRILCSFHSDDGFDGSIGEGAMSFGYVVGGSFTKSFGGRGTWTLRIKTTPQAPDLLSHYADPEDVWVRIQARINGHLYDLVIGLIDSISENVTRNPDGSRVLTYDIHGSDFGKCFEHYELFTTLWASSGPPIPQWVSYSAEAISRNLPLGKPNEVVRALIEMWLGNNGAAEKQWLLPSSLRGSTGKRYLFDWLNLGNISQGLRGALANDPNLLSPEPMMGRSLWDAMQEYSNNLLNELWVDLAPDPDLPNEGKNRLDALRPSVFMRERPFPTIKSTRRWDSLRTIELTANDVKRRQLVLGDGGNSRFNWWELIPQGLSAELLDTQAMMHSQVSNGAPGSFPIYDLTSIRKHGLRRFSQQSKYLVLPQGENDPSFIDYAKRWVRIVHDWYSVAPYQRTGQLVLARMRPEIRIGMKVRETRHDGSVWTYYVEGVEHSYNYPGEGTTKLTVTRGQKEAKNFLNRVYQAYRGVDLSTLSDDEVRAGTSENSAKTPSSSDKAPSLEAEADLPIPPEEGFQGPPGAGTGGGEREAVVTEDGRVQIIDNTTDAYDGEMVSPPEPSEDEDVTQEELEGTDNEDTGRVVQIEPVVVPTPRPQGPGGPRREGSGR